MTRTKALTDVLDDLAGFEFDVAQYYSDSELEPQMVIDAVLLGKINSLRLFCQTLGWSDLVAALLEMIPLRGSVVPSLSTIQEFVIPEVRSRLATTDVDSSKTSPAERSSGSPKRNTPTLEDDCPLIDVSTTSRGYFLVGGYRTQGIAKGATPTDSAAWRGKGAGQSRHRLDRFRCHAYCNRCQHRAISGGSLNVATSRQTKESNVLPYKFPYSPEKAKRCVVHHLDSIGRGGAI